MRSTAPETEADEARNQDRAPVAGVVSGRRSPRAADEHRSLEVKHEFQQRHPCPSSGRPIGGCPGHIKDHIVPLALRRTKRGFQHAMADDRRGEGQGQVGAEGLQPSLGLIAALLRPGEHHIDLAATTTRADEASAPG
jgi:hypothetical protein